MIMDILQILLSESFWSASIRIATPLIFGVLGALICEKSGVLNLGIEGIFVAGAMAGWMAVWLGAGLWGGVLFAILAVGALGLLHGILTEWYSNGNLKHKKKYDNGTLIELLENYDINGSKLD